MVSYICISVCRLSNLLLVHFHFHLAMCRTTNRLRFGDARRTALPRRSHHRDLRRDFGDSAHGHRRERSEGVQLNTPRYVVGSRPQILDGIAYNSCLVLSPWSFCRSTVLNIGDYHTYVRRCYRFEICDGCEKRSLR